MRTVALRPIDQLAADWEATKKSAESRRAIAALSSVEDEIAALGVGDLGELVCALQSSTGVEGRNRSARLLRAMLRSQHAHPLVPRAVLQAVIPGLVTVARRLSWGSGGDWSDGGAFFADLIATAWEVISAWAGEDRPYAVLDLLSAIRCRMRRQLLKDRESHETSISCDLEERLETAASTGTTALEDLARSIDALSGHGLDPSDGAVLYASRVLGLSMSELARISGQSRRRLTGSRQRAEQVLYA